jgi:hypothetical protein
MKTMLRSAVALAFLASAAPALAGEDPPDQGFTGVSQLRSWAETSSHPRAPRAETGEISVATPAEGAPVQAAQDVEQDARTADPFSSFDRSMDAGG